MADVGRYRVWRALLLVVVAGVAVGSLHALDVDQDELEGTADESVEFQNYEGPYEDIDTAEDIAGIGSFLATPPLLPGEERSYFGRYRMLHAVDPEADEGLDADILYISDQAAVDHIDNVRRILSSYLSTAYGYGAQDAALLAELVTVYNAVHRGDPAFFAERYKQIVTDNLSEDGVGISTLYSDWPGATELVTPLSVPARPGRLGAISPLQLTDDMLIEELRRRPDMGLEERRALVDFLERVIEERREEIAEEQEAIEEEREAIEEAEEETAAEEPADEAEEEPAEPTEPEEEPAPEPAEEEPTEEAAPTEEAEPAEEAEEQPTEEPAEEEAPAEAEEEPQEEPAEEEQDLEQRREDLEEREEELAEEEEEVEELEEEVREQREQIAEDTQEQISEEDAQPTPISFLRTRREDGAILRTPVGVNPETGEVMTESPVDSVSSPDYVVVEGNLVVVAEYEDRSRLVQLDPETLEVLSFGEAEVAQGSYLIRDDEAVFAVVREDDDWYLGRFDTALELRARSSQPVLPESYLRVEGERVFAEGADGAVLSLDRDSL
jgi:hypothetical protein